MTSYPVAQVEIVINGMVHEIAAGLSPSLPHSVLLGTDVPPMLELLPGLSKDALIMTRAQLRRQEREDSLRWDRQQAESSEAHNLPSQGMTDAADEVALNSPLLTEEIGKDQTEDKLEDFFHLTRIYFQEAMCAQSYPKDKGAKRAGRPQTQEVSWT